MRQLSLIGEGVGSHYKEGGDIIDTDTLVSSGYNSLYIVLNFFQTTIFDNIML